MEGDYLWEKWCFDHGYPKTITEFALLFPGKTIDEIDKLWDAILQEYEEDTK